MPNPIAVAAANITHNGISSSGIKSAANKIKTIIPIVFCPSFAPCVKANHADEIICNLPNVLFTTAGFLLANKNMISPVTAMPKIIPPIGATTIPVKTLPNPS